MHQMSEILNMYMKQTMTKLKEKYTTNNNCKWLKGLTFNNRQKINQEIVIYKHILYI